MKHTPKSIVSQVKFFKNENFVYISAEFTSWNQAIRDVRTAHKLTQAQLGTALGYSPQQISRFESGQGEPPIHFWKGFTECFGVNIEWMLFGRSPVYADGPTDPSVLQSIATAAIEAELKERRHMADGFRLQAAGIRKDLLARGPDPGEKYEAFRKRVKQLQEQIIPPDAPKWLRDDLEQIHLS